MSNARLQCWLGLAFLIFAGLVFEAIIHYRTFVHAFYLLPATIILSFMFSIAVGLRKDPTRNEIETDEESRK